MALKKKKIAKVGTDFICPLCGLFFLKEKDLKSHKAEHKGQLNNRCGRCLKSFTRKDTLKLHIQRQVCFRVHKCSNCRKSFFTKQELDSHEETHLLHKCKFCKVFFSNLKNLHRHERLHSAMREMRGAKKVAVTSSNKNLECPVCDRVFFKGWPFRCHLRMHINEDGHRCCSCGKALTSVLKKRGCSDTGRELHCANCDSAYIQQAILNKPDTFKSTIIQIRCLGEPSVLQILMGN